jgi:hypothetical protein
MSITSSCQKPRNHKYYFFYWNKGPESAAEYYTVFSADVRNTSYHKNLHYPHLGVVNMCDVR